MIHNLASSSGRGWSPTSRCCSSSPTRRFSFRFGFAFWGLALGAPLLIAACVRHRGHSVSLQLFDFPPLGDLPMRRRRPAPEAQAPLPVAAMAQPRRPVPLRAPASPAPAGAAAPAATAPAPAPWAFPYAVALGNDPETGFSPTVGGRSGMKAPAATIPAAAAAVPARAIGARRRRRSAMHDHGDEFLDMNVDVDPDWGGPTNEAERLAFATASGSGAGQLGFAGTAAKDADLQAAGLTKLAGDEFGGGPRMPMVPGTWDHDTEGPHEPEESARGGRDS